MTPLVPTVQRQIFNRISLAAMSTAILGNSVVGGSKNLTPLNINCIDAMSVLLWERSGETTSQRTSPILRRSRT